MKSLEKHSIMGLKALRLNSALIITVTPTFEALVAPLEWCLYLLGTVVVPLHSVLAQFFEPSIVFIYSCPVEIPFWQREMYRKATNDEFSIL
jgi:hypothetical protein